MTYRRPYSVPDNELLRLEKLREYHILDTHSEDTFDKIALLAAQVFNTSGAFINFVDQDRVFVKSNVSLLHFQDVPRADSICSLAITSDHVTVFNDALESPELANKSDKILESGVRFYAAAPLKTPEGFNVGTICVVNNTPLHPAEEQLDMLKTMASLVIDKLENRLRYRKSIESQVNLMNIVLHEIKNPLASIKLANEIISKKPESAVRMTDNIQSAVVRIQTKLSELLKQSELEEKDMMLNIEEVDLKEMFVRLLYNFELLANRKKQVIEFNCDESLPKIEADRTKISDVLHNLLSNAIKYSYHDTTIKVTAREAGNYVHIEVKDEGQGLNFSDMQKLFTKFAKLSSTPTGKETSNGLGLSITKSFVELHDGNIYAMSPGKDKGTTFIVSIPFKHKRNEELTEISELNP
ncbi:GAF domain-containing protein [Flavobacterium sp. Sd200]|uniref:GAF domain-containing sensor histidine kinase n=1 Tax=Flavobacterium sp. Sd200 TaxID=2692211 RepID=UPI00136DE5CA|nr:GAF domain-containing sensor histidine kinase [Flavobacterium sp. Sd200]MXN89790.1 GAF domain-containing protein [Flavobacterium sp. Sd200]